ncbi:hypothetical protein DY000_02064093 [Brassica cretica]|uniref:FBD domain-containing protein n=1 Tax=Brassica cretica TaxID=69181 RepID=A0ABQ7AW69_BRACR|nr:hypothetical protein DY000_02064093 [Brassica cretica]
MQNVLSKRCWRNDEGVDMISKLPQARIFQILSLLPQRDVHYGDGKTFSDNVSSVLLSYEAPVLESLRLRFSLDNCAPADLELCISIAYLHRVRELELDVVGPSSFKLPVNFLYSRDLDTLKLKNFVLVDCRQDRYLKWDYVKTFTIAVPTLKRFDICDWNWNGPEKEQEFGYYKINAPCLKYLKIKGTRDIQFRLVEMIANSTSDEDLLRIRIVSLSSRSSLISCGWDYRKVCSGRWNQPKNVPECLETFVWNCCKEQQEKEKGVANYILRNANRLKKARIIMKEFNSLERLKMLEEFKSVVKASNSSCNISFEHSL